jgi:hypothetical protein
VAGARGGAQLEFTLRNIERTILRNQFEEPIKVQMFGYAEKEGLSRDGLTMRFRRTVGNEASTNCGLSPSEPPPLPPPPFRLNRGQPHAKPQ